MTVAERLKAPGGKYLLGTDEFWKRYFYPSDVRSESVVVGGGCVAVFPACWEQLLEYMQVTLKYWIRF